jgi:hypothetical protein
MLTVGSNPTVSARNNNEVKIVKSTTYKMSKQIKTQLALIPWNSKEEKNAFKRLMVEAEIHEFHNSKKALARLPESIDAQ